MASATPVVQRAADDKDSANVITAGLEKPENASSAVTRPVKTRATKTSMATTSTRSFSLMNRIRAPMQDGQDHNIIGRHTYSLPSSAGWILLFTYIPYPSPLNSYSLNSMIFKATFKTYYMVFHGF